MVLHRGHFFFPFPEPTVVILRAAPVAYGFRRRLHLVLAMPQPAGTRRCWRYRSQRVGGGADAISARAHEEVMLAPQAQNTRR